MKKKWYNRENSGRGLEGVAKQGYKGSDEIESIGKDKQRNNGIEEIVKEIK